jgi:PHD/YefM family antitoxin component YafN of YafNO toxin-antitoxin module
MQNSQLNKVLNLVKRTGDKVVILDNESDNAMVMMGLDAYEKILNNQDSIEDLSEEQLLERINRDIAIWRSYNEKENEAHVSSESDDAKFIKLAEKEAQEPVMETEIQEIPKIEEEDLKNMAEDEEEEKFYLEPIE